MVRLLSREDVSSVLTMPDALRSVEDAFRQLVLGTARVPQRIIMSEPAPGTTLVMPGMIGGGMNALATKIVSVYKDNPVKHNKPTILAKIMVQDIQTGEIVGIMDGGLITAMRTGAATGVSVKYLGRKGARIMGIYGAGVQAKKQVLAVHWALERKLELCIVHDVKRAASESFKAEVEKELGIKVDIAESGDKLLKGADILVTASTSTTPLFDGNDVAEGTHVSSIGAHAPAHHEMDTALIRRAAIVAADHQPACLAEAGEYIKAVKEGVISPQDIISIGEIIDGRRPGRTDDRQITVFKSVGISAQDVAVAKLVYDRAIENGVGKDLDF
jgi:ornithine cyclodeaminase/alanine dehydrogenase-like protein (mu-crystallin family)